MKHLKLASLVALSLAVGAGAAFAQDKVMPSDAVVKFATEIGNKVGANADVQAAIKAATDKHRKFSYDDQVLHDSQWRVAKSGAEKEKKAAGKLKGLSDADISEHIKAGEALIKASLESDTSKFVTGVMESAEPKGAVTEIVVTDGWGWNVGQTGGTSDYFQGDEPKWQKPFIGETDIGAVEDDGGVQVTQISVPVKEGDKIIGAVTVGVDVSKVK